MCNAPYSYPKCAQCMGVGLVGPISTVYMLCPVHADNLYTRHTLDLKWTHDSMCHEGRHIKDIHFINNTSCFHLEDLSPCPQELDIGLGVKLGEEAL